MTKKEIVKAMLDAVLEAEARTGGQIWFETIPHVDSVRVHTVDTKRYPTDGGDYEVVNLLDMTEPTEEALDALRWRLLPENLRKVWTR